MSSRCPVDCQHVSNRFPAAFQQVSSRFPACPQQVSSRFLAGVQQVSSILPAGFQHLRLAVTVNQVTARKTRRAFLFTKPSLSRASSLQTQSPASSRQPPALCLQPSASSRQPPALSLQPQPPAMSHLDALESRKTTRLDRIMTQSGIHYPGLFQSSQATVLELWASPDLLRLPWTQLDSSWSHLETKRPDHQKVGV